MLIHILSRSGRANCSHPSSCICISHHQKEFSIKASILGVFLILLIPAVCSAGEESIATQKKQSDANITGHVVDAKTREHLAFATIAVKGTTIGIATDATGHYFLKNLPQGRFTLVASSVGYKSVEQTISNYRKRLFRSKRWSFRQAARRPTRKHHQPSYL